MDSKENLTIHKLVFDIQVEDKAAYKHFADRISNLCKIKLPNRLDEVLRKHKIPDGSLVINKLQINLGKIKPNSFENRIVGAIAVELDSFLSKYIGEIEKKLSQVKFKFSDGRKFSINESEFSFESDIRIPKSVILPREIMVGPTKEVLLLNKKSVEISSKESDNSKLYIDLLEKVKIKLEEDDRTITTSEKLLENKNGSEDESQDAISSDLTESGIEKSKSKIRTANEIESKFKIANEIDSSSSQLFVKDTSINEVEGEKAKEVELSGNDQTSPQKTKSKKLSLLDQIKNLTEIPNDLPPKATSELEKAFLYYIRYGRLPSNIKYELGMKMLDVFNVNQQDVRFFNELKKHISKSDKAKERLIRLTDDSNKQSLIRKNIFEKKEIEEFDLKIPKAFEDYFVALVLEKDLSTFTPEMLRYTLNDMVRFFYADHPQKLKSIVKFLLFNEDIEGDLRSRIEKLFEKLGKASIVKIIASFIRKAGMVNKSLNQLNKKFDRNVKSAHTSVLLAFLINRDPLDQLREDKFLIDEEDQLLISPRVFLKKEPTYSLGQLTNADIVNYFLTYGTLPFSSTDKIPSIDQLSIMIQTLSAAQLKSIPYFRDKTYENTIKHQTIGLISEKAVEHIIKSLASNISKEVLTKFKFYEIHLEGGVPKSFQRTFAIYYALRNKSISYLEEMVNFWKKEFGDADLIIKKRWKISNEIEGEFNKLLHIKEEKLEKQLQVDYEFQSYSKDISIKNAGLVLLWPFLKVYFNMLDLLNATGDFRSITERARACHLLQYLAVKQAEGEELYYPLNKILTGYPLDEPLPYEIKMTEKEIDVSNALLKNVIKQWNALKGSSVDALRGSFLIRDGVIVPSPNGWLLTVEKKAYDILLDKLPWGIGMIKLSWAPYVLNVEWERNI